MNMDEYYHDAQRMQNLIKDKRNLVVLLPQEEVLEGVVKTYQTYYSSLCLADKTNPIVLALPPSSSSPSPLPLSSTTDKEKNLAEQAQRINNELLLERQLGVADAARKALEEEGGRKVHNQAQNTNR